MRTKYNEMTLGRLACLRVVATARTRMDHEDTALLPFMDDNSTLSAPDIFNQCHDAGWLKSWHDNRMDCSYVELTDAGKAALSLHNGKQP